MNLTTHIASFMNEAASEKDYTRINDIVKRANGNSSKQLQAATNMASKITGKQKSEDRYLAASEILGNDDPASQVFLRRAIELGNKQLEVFVIADATQSKTTEKEFDVEVLASRNSVMQRLGKLIKNETSWSSTIPITDIVSAVNIGKYNFSSGKTPKIDAKKSYEQGIVYYATSGKIKYLVFDKLAKQAAFAIGSKLYIGNPALISDTHSNNLLKVTIDDWCKVENIDVLGNEHSLKSADAYVIK